MLNSKACLYNISFLSVSSKRKKNVKQDTSPEKEEQEKVANKLRNLEIFITIFFLHNIHM